MCGDVMTCAGTCSQAQSHEPPQKLEELRQLKRGFPGFLLSTKVKKNHSIRDKNLWRMKQFYETYKDADEKLSALLRQTSWTNNLIIMSRTKSSDERLFYLI
ncbi:MAG: hypothetical protein J6W21_01655 [Bacteroidaceae bacterium]|nr:hypothetical protein [Bacteroidaceae bacterium]